MTSPEDLNPKRNIATRQSPLAMWQAEETAAHLKAMGFDSEIIGTETSGDRIQHTMLSQIHLARAQSLTQGSPSEASGEETPLLQHVHHLTTGKGLFIKEVQDLVLKGQCHLAVHSMKDLPVSQTPGLVLAGFLPAGAVRDVLVFAPHRGLDLRGQHSVSAAWFDGTLSIGTTSLRRQALLSTTGLGHIPRTVLRGNVATRLGRLAAGEFAAIILAEAGLRRLGLFDPSCMMPLDESVFIPACAQGIVGIETRADDDRLTVALYRATAPETLLRACVERLLLDLLGGDCNSVIGIHCSGLQFQGTELHLEEARLSVFTATPNFATQHTSTIPLGSRALRGHEHQDPSEHHESRARATRALREWAQRVSKNLASLSSFSELFAQAQNHGELVEPLREFLAERGHVSDAAPPSSEPLK